MESLVYLSKDDVYEVKLGSMLASYDRDILTLLYQPIVGYAGISLYFTLWGEVKRMEFSPMDPHARLLKATGMELTQFLEARTRLEGIGLLRSYRKKLSDKTDSYTYELYAPKSPEEFFKDVIYKGMLSKKLGSKEVEKLSMIFSSRPLESEGMTEITAKFSDTYSMDDEESLKVLNVRTRRGRKTINISSSFDIGELFRELKEASSILPEAFTAEDVQEIQRLATLFGMDVVSMCEIITRVYDGGTANHLDYRKLYDLCGKYKDGIRIQDSADGSRSYKEDDRFGQKLNEMTEYAPFDYLRLKQGFTNPSPADIRILNLLSEKYALANPVINALIDYTLIQCDDSLPLAYVEKVAATLARKGVTTALAACNALKGNRRSSAVKEKEKEPEAEEQKENIDVDALMKELEEL